MKKVLLVLTVCIGVGAHAAKIIGNGHSVGETGQRSLVYRQKVTRIMDRVRSRYPHMALAVEREFVQMDQALSLECVSQQFSINDPEQLWESLNDLNKARLAVYEALCRSTRDGVENRDVKAVAFVIDLILRGQLKTVVSQSSLGWSIEVESQQSSEEMTGYSQMSGVLFNR